MTIFIETKTQDRARINSSEIVYLWDEPRSEKNKPITTLAELRDGTKVRLDWMAKTVAKACCQVLPAQPGFEMLAAWFDDDGTFHCGRQPVIGWRVVAGGVEPVGPCDEWGHDAYNAIRYPDGQLIGYLEDAYADEAAWRAAMEERNKEEREAALKVVP